MEPKHNKQHEIA